MQPHQTNSTVASPPPPRRVSWGELEGIVQEIHDDGLEWLRQAEASGNRHEIRKLRRLVTQTEQFMLEHGIR